MPRVPSSRSGTWTKAGALSDALRREVTRRGDELLARTFRPLLAHETGMRKHGIALIGSIVTAKPTPKDIDLIGDGHRRCRSDFPSNLCTPTAGWAPRVKSLGRRVSRGRARAIPRPHLHDDLGDVRVTQALIANPPVQLWPTWSGVVRCHATSKTCLPHSNTPSNEIGFAADGGRCDHEPPRLKPGRRQDRTW